MSHWVVLPGWRALLSTMPVLRQTHPWRLHIITVSPIGATTHASHVDRFALGSLDWRDWLSLTARVSDGAGDQVSFCQLLEHETMREPDLGEAFTFDLVA